MKLVTELIEAKQLLKEELTAHTDPTKVRTSKRAVLTRGL
jgi:hypothetical protein